MLFIVFFESLALQRLLLAKHQPQHKYNEVRSSYGDILLSIADFRIAGKEISGSSRNVNKQQAIWKKNGLPTDPGQSVPQADHNKNHLSSLYYSFLSQRICYRQLLFYIFTLQECTACRLQTMHFLFIFANNLNYFLSSIPRSSRPFRILFMAAVISASSSVLSFARNTIE